MKIGRLFFLVLLMVVACKRPEPEIIEHIVEKLDTIETIIVIGNIPGRIVSIQEFGVLPTNSAAVNKQKLQEAIDYAQKDGLALYVTPVENGYPMDGGLVLKRNVSLVGAHGPTGRGTANRDKTHSSNRSTNFIAFSPSQPARARAIAGSGLFRAS